MGKRKASQRPVEMIRDIEQTIAQLLYTGRDINLIREIYEDSPILEQTLNNYYEELAQEAVYNGFTIRCPCLCCAIPHTHTTGKDCSLRNVCEHYMFWL